jgi:hypothetical protein
VWSDPCLTFTLGLLWKKLMNKWRPVERRSCSDEESYFFTGFICPPPSSLHVVGDCTRSAHCSFIFLSKGLYVTLNFSSLSEHDYASVTANTLKPIGCSSYCAHIHLYNYTLTYLRKFYVLGMTDGFDDCFIQLCTPWLWVSKARNMQEFVY